MSSTKARPSPLTFLRLIAALLVAASAHGQEPAPLTTVAQVLDGGVSQTGQTARAVRVKGVVVSVSGMFNFFYLHEGGRCVAVRYPRRLAPPALGDRVEVEGSTMVNMLGGLRQMRVSADEFIITGSGDLPVPEPATLEKLLSDSAMDQWLSCQARVAGWRLDGTDLRLRLVLDGGVFDGFVSLPGAGAPPDKLHGARLRLTGVVTFAPVLGRLIFVPGISQFEVLETGVNDPFEAETIPASQVSSEANAGCRPARVRGIVLGRTSDGAIHIRDDGTALRAALRQPWSGEERTGARARETAPAAGDEVEITGFSHDARFGETTPPGCDLLECVLRLTGRKEPPQPVTAALAEIAAGERTSDWVETRGRLVTLHQVPLENGEWRSTLMIEADGARMPVAFRAGGRPAFDTIKPDDDVLVRGLVERATALSPRQMRLLDDADVRSLGVSAVVRARQLWLWGGGTLAVIALFSGWIAALRKSNRVKTRVAALLEKRVAERTAELEKAQAEITRALAQERELGDLKSRFVTMVSHEFRTPLGIIMSAIELMRHYNDRLPPDQRLELQNDIFTSTRHMAGLMEQVLVLGRVEAGKLGCKTAPCDLDILAGKIVDENLSATNRKCPVIWRSEGGLDGARADESLLRHIFSNLITNAVKYSPEGGEVLLTARREGGDAVFQVVDHGIGIPENERGRLFEAFHRCSNVGETPGTGLGLVIVKRCVELHGGSVHVESATGKGTAFTVRLPLFAGQDDGK
ncbi:MAG TPA: hypothetical protein DIT13_17340 [Verrucomicrobiales bacterium]|nr:hypothetical protein [Verrucomicrobiales bacterium]HRJ08217.1 HAMP domain-containing sensor histidine kinase [Prosthecobacter sp.]HRK15934.1 HAMP domain-containing sensor histidine kinase [Prosthecobacter sp.]